MVKPSLAALTFGTWRLYILQLADVTFEFCYLNFGPNSISFAIEFQNLLFNAVKLYMIRYLVVYIIYYIIYYNSMIIVVEFHNITTLRLTLSNSTNRCLSLLNFTTRINITKFYLNLHVFYNSTILFSHHSKFLKS